MLPLSGLRLVLTAGVPGPWGEAAKGVFHVKGVPFARVRQEAGAANQELVEWTGHDNAPVAVYDDERARRIIRRALGLGRAFGRSKWGKRYGVAEVHYDHVQGFSVLTDAPATEVLLGKEKLFERVERVDNFAKSIRARRGRVQYILADEPGRVIVKYRTNNTKSEV